MKIYRFDIGTAEPIALNGSEYAAMTRLVQVQTETSAVCIYLGSGGLVAGHEAISNQLFLVVAGRGWVRTKNTEPMMVQMGHAIFWKSGEWHESGTHHGMVAIVLEGEDVNPSTHMKELFDESK